jgi:hypothetical protein
MKEHGEKCSFTSVGFGKALFFFTSFDVGKTLFLCPDKTEKFGSLLGRCKVGDERTCDTSSFRWWR